MSSRTVFRKIHRWLGVLMALQISAWMASGLWFSIFPIEEIRGEHLTRSAESLELERFDDETSPAGLQQALDQHFEGQSWVVSSAQWVRLGGQLYWRLTGISAGASFTRLVSVEEARVQPMLSAAAAEQKALSWLLEPAQADAVEWVGQGESDTEIRGRDGPLWRVRFAQPESLNLYLDPWTGEIVARRTDRWRVFDFFWMLHIMDYQSRTDAHNRLLITAQFTGVVFAATGIWLLFHVFRSRRRRSTQ